MAIAQAQMFQLSFLLFPQIVHIQLLPPSQVELLVVVVVVVPRTPHMNRIALGAFNTIETFPVLTALAIVVATVFAGGVFRRRVGLIVMMVVVMVNVMMVVVMMMMMMVMVLVSFIR